MFYGHDSMSTKPAAMDTTHETIEILNDLISINNDRINGYEKALKDTKSNDADLKPLFTHMIDESRTLRNALGKEVQGLGGEMGKGSTASGRLFRAWMDVKAVFTGHDRQSVLSNCEAGEDAAQRAYMDALQDGHLPHYLQEMLAQQQSTLRSERDRIHSLRSRD